MGCGDQPKKHDPFGPSQSAVDLAQHPLLAGFHSVQLRGRTIVGDHAGDDAIAVVAGSMP